MKKIIVRKMTDLSWWSLHGPGGEPAVLDTGQDIDGAAHYTKSDGTKILFRPRTFEASPGIQPSEMLNEQAWSWVVSDEETGFHKAGFAATEEAARSEAETV